MPGGANSGTSLLERIIQTQQAAKRAREARLAALDSEAKRAARHGTPESSHASHSSSAPALDGLTAPSAASIGPPSQTSNLLGGSPAPGEVQQAAASVAEAAAVVAQGATPTAALPSRARLPGFKSRSFYSNNRLQQVEDRVLRFFANVQSRLQSGGFPDSCASSVWESFPLQQPAFDCADAHNGANESRPVRVFSLEQGPQAKRRFLATSYAQLWRRYREMPRGLRHFYEIVRHRWPCHMYFDLEYSVEENPEADGSAAVEALLGLVAELLLEKFGLSFEASWALELDSSTPAKFSRHLIVRLPGSAFACNAHVGAFVREVCARALERRGDDPAAARLFVKKGGEEALFVDLAVYSRNRAFRLYLSSKAGREAVLDCTGRFGGARLSQQEVFMRALICNVDPSAGLLRCFEEGSEGSGAGLVGAAAGLAGTAAAALRQLGGNRGGSSGSSTAWLSGHAAVQYGPSPFPQIEEFIVAVCKEACGQATDVSIRSWALLDGGSVLLLSVRGSRWCERVGRQHRSNGVYYVVDLQQGWWTQKCFDPDCRSYRSPLTALPQHLLALYQQQQKQQKEEQQQAPDSHPAAAAAMLAEAQQPHWQGQQLGCASPAEAAGHMAEHHKQQQQQQPWKSHWAGGTDVPSLQGCGHGASGGQQAAMCPSQPAEPQGQGSGWPSAQFDPGGVEGTSRGRGDSALDVDDDITDDIMLEALCKYEQQEQQQSWGQQDPYGVQCMRAS